MTKYRIIKAKSIKKEFLSELIKHFQDWEKMREYFADTPKGRYLKELIKNIKEIQFKKNALNPGESTNINYTIKMDILGMEDGAWVSKEECKILFIKDSYILLQQPDSIFEKLLKLKLELADGIAPKSPFEGKTISKLVGILNKAKNDLKFGNMHVYRVIFHNVLMDDQDDEYLEFNIKKKEVSLEEIKNIEERAAKWHAFSIKVEIPTSKKPLKSVSVRFDRYGKILLFGAPEKETDKIIATFLGKIVEKI